MTPLRCISDCSLHRSKFCFVPLVHLILWVTYIFFSSYTIQCNTHNAKKSVDFKNQVTPWVFGQVQATRPKNKPTDIFSVLTSSSQREVYYVSVVLLLIFN